MARWAEADMPDLTGKRCVVTGANSGLGLNTTRALAMRGAQVVMACRTQAKAELAMAEIRKAAPTADLQFLALDLADLDSVRACARVLVDAAEPIDLLINNAGVMAVPKGKTKDGFETQIGTNHFGHFALTGLLLDSLADHARVVCVASMAHRWTPGINLEDINWEQRKYRRWQAYGDSKLANLLFMHELSRRLEAAERNVIAVGAHPGYADTHLQYVAAEQKQSSFEAFYMKVGNALFAQPAAMGALPSLYAAVAADVKSGDYIGPDGFKQMRGYPAQVGCRKMARDRHLAEALWSQSEAATSVQFLS